MENGFVDCHCHISAHEFEEDLDDVIKRSREAGIKTLVAVTEEIGEFKRVLQLQESYPDLVAPCFGVHPLQPERRSVNLQDLEGALPHFYNHREQLVAIGEIGLDFTPWCVSTQQDRDDQMKVFVKQLDIAKELDLPVNVHTRSAARLAIETMRERGWILSRRQISQTSAGSDFTVSCQRDKLIKQIPLEHICLETDSPALGPEKHERNEPSNITLCCSYIAKVKGLSPQTVQTITTQNAYKLFPKADRC